MKQQFIVSNSYLLLILIFIIGFGIRLAFISNNNISFWYDQARDASIAQEMYQKGDLKIQGPSASGTSETIFHGVLYYYFLAILYFLSGGNPHLPTIALAFLNTLTIVPLFLLVKSISKSDLAGILAAMLFAFSSEAVQLATWLSNPSLALLFLAIFYLCYWKCFFELNNNQYWFFGLCISLGILIQSAIWFGYLSFVVAVGIVIRFKTWDQKFDPIVNRKTLFFGLIILITICASMIITQIKIAQAGILSTKHVFEMLHEGNSPSSSEFQKVALTYLRKISSSLFPTLPNISIMLAIGIFIFTTYLPKIKKIFLATMLLSPLWLLVIFPKDTYYSYMGIEMAIYVLLAVISFNSKVKYSKILTTTFVVIFMASNLQMLKSNYISKFTNYSLAIGNNLNDQIKLMNYIYHHSSSQPFSVSTFTNPYGYNTTWSYLLSWYADSKKLQSPSFYGPSQAGLYGGELLDQVANPEKIHFTIIETHDVAPEQFKTQFLEDQNIHAGTIVGQKEFGSIIVQKRESALD